MIKKYFLQILVVLLMLAIAWVLLSLKEESSSVPQKTEENQRAQANIYQAGGDKIANNIGPEFFPIRNWLIDEPEISAKSAIIVNFKTDSEKSDILYQKNLNQILPIASLTKIMTAIIVLENLNPDEIIKISKNSVTVSGDKGGLIRDEELTVENLLYLMLMESSNDAAMALAGDSPRLIYNEFVNLMNSKVQELNLKNTTFSDPIGLDSGNKSTVLELANLTKYALNFVLISEILKTSKKTVSSIDNKFSHNLINTNRLLDKIPQIIGGKTGFTEEASGCMLTISNISNNYLITIVLGSDQRENDIEKLVKWAQEAWLWQ